MIQLGYVIAYVPDVPAAVAAGAVLLRDAETKPWGQVVAYVRDPDGILIELCTPVGGSSSP